MTKMHTVLVKHVDAYLTMPDQIAQEADGGYEDGASMLSDPILWPMILSGFVQGVFGPEFMVQWGGLQTLLPWSLLSIFNLHIHCWQHWLDRFKVNHTKAIDAANAAWAGMFGV